MLEISLDFAVERSEVGQILMLQLHTITQIIKNGIALEMLDFAVERWRLVQILMLLLHTITQGTVERSPSLRSTKLRASTTEARISPIWVLRRFSVQSHGELRHVLTYWDNSAKNSAKFLTFPLPSSLYKPKGKLNECTFLVFLC